MSEQTIKILFVTRAHQKNAGGMERLSFELTNEISKLPNIKSTVIKHSGTRSTSPFFNITALPKLLTMASQYDIIHIGDPMISFLGWFAKKILRKKVAINVHGLDILFANPLYQLYLRIFFRKLDLYLPISAHVKDLLSRHFVQGTQTIINPGISDQYHESNIAREELSKQLGFDTKEQTILLTTGRLVKRKGHVWFISNVLPNLPDHYHYVIAGSGPEEQPIKEAIEDNNLSGQVHLLGRISDHQLKELYNTVNAFIQPNIEVSNDVEGFGLVLLEAALCNLPVYVSSIEGMTDAIHDQKNGFLVSSNNPTAWLSALSKIQPIPNARQFTLNNYSWNKQSNQYLAAFDALKK